MLHELIDALPAEELDLVERLLARLEMVRLWKDVRKGFTRDWEEGKFVRLDEIIGEVREDLRKRSAWSMSTIQDDEWDREFADDAESGLLDGIAAAALAEHRAGKSTPLPRDEK